MREGRANRNAAATSNPRPPLSLMQKLLRLFLFLLGVSSAFAQGGREIVVNIVVDKNAIPVRVTANTPELTALAQQAFSVHGRYKVVASGFDYDFKFSQVT